MPSRSSSSSIPMSPPHYRAFKGVYPGCPVEIRKWPGNRHSSRALSTGQSLTVFFSGFITCLLFCRGGWKDKRADVQFSSCVWPGSCWVQTLPRGSQSLLREGTKAKENADTGARPPGLRSPALPLFSLDKNHITSLLWFS